MEDSLSLSLLPDIMCVFLCAKWVVVCGLPLAIGKIATKTADKHHRWQH